MSEAPRSREEPRPEDDGRAAPPGEEAAGVVEVTIRRRDGHDPAAGAPELAAVLVSLAGGGLAAGALGASLGLALAVAAAHVLLVRPLCRTGARLHADRARLRAALACPYCKDAVSDEAVGCERAGCGALYHRECWEECRASYGGCAVYGCGCTTAREVGRFALRRRALRLLLAAALFPPRVVQRLRAGGADGKGLLRWAWQEAVAVQENASASCSQSLLVGGVNLALCLGLLRWLTDLPLLPTWDPLAVPKVVALVAVAAVVLMRLPLLSQLVWNVLGVLTEALAGEISALARVDAGEGTVLQRLSRGGGKKEVT